MNITIFSNINIYYLLIGILFLLNIIVFSSLFVTLKKYKKIKPYKKQFQNIQIGFEDISLDFVQGLMAREKMKGAKKLLDDGRLKLSHEENKLYYYLLRIIYNYYQKDIREGRKWIEYTVNFFNNSENPLILSKNINKMVKLVNEKISNQNEREMLLDMIDLIKGRKNIEEFEDSYVAYLRKQKEHIREMIR